MRYGVIKICFLNYKTIKSQIMSYVTKKTHSDSQEGTIFRNMAMLASGTIAAKALGILTVPVITRLYQPEHFGVLSVFTAITALFVPFGTLRYAMAIPLPRHDGMAANLSVLCGLCMLITSSLTFLVFWLTAPVLLELLSMEQLLPFWWLLPVAVSGSGIYELLSNWAIREKAFKPLAKTRVWQAIIGSTVKIGFGFLGIKPLGLLIGQVFSEAGGIFSLARSFEQKFRSNCRHVTRKRMIFALKWFADFPRYRLPSQFLLIVSSRAPLLYYAWRFGPETTGQLSLALTMIAMPMTLFGQTTGQAYYSEIAKIGNKNPEKIYKITKDITKKLILISVPPFLILVISGPWLFQFVFGENWHEAGVFSRILAIYLLTQFVSSPLVNAMTVFEKLRMFFIINLVRVVGLAILFIISYVLDLSSKSTIIFYSFGLSLHYIFTAFIIFRVIEYAKYNNR